MLCLQVRTLEVPEAQVPMVQSFSGTTNTCGQLGCHTASTTTTVILELDSAGVSASRYAPGKSYTIKITGTNTSSASLPRFGFELTVVKSSGAGTSSAVNAGTLQSTGLPASVQYTGKAASLLPFDVVEHSAPILATSGSGGTGTTYVESIGWTAPTTGTGSVKIYGCINAVNFNNGSDGDAYNSATPLTISEIVPTAVVNVSDNMSIKAFPNPTNNNLHLQIDNAQTGDYSLQVYSLSAKVIATEHITVNGSQAVSINTANWAPGTYMVSVEKDGNRQVIPVVKTP